MCVYIRQLSLFSLFITPSTLVPMLCSVGMVFPSYNITVFEGLSIYFNTYTFFPQIINFYMNMLMERSKEKGMPSVHAFNTFFFTKLKTAGYQAVKRWTKKVDVFSVDILLVPIHLGVHWCLAVSTCFIFVKRNLCTSRIHRK